MVSNFFVSSRARTTRRVGASTSAISASSSRTRCGASNSTNAEDSAASARSCRSRSARPVGRKPTKRNGPGARPAARDRGHRAARSGNGHDAVPGVEDRAHHARARDRKRRGCPHPSPGRPAPRARGARSSRVAASCSLCWWAAVSGVSMPNRASRGRVTRVSSAAITSIRASSQSARSVMSAALPMGNATTYNEPAGSSCSVTPETSNSRSCLLSARSPMIPTTTVARARHLVAALVLASVACSLRAQITALPAQPARCTAPPVKRRRRSR